MCIEVNLRVLRTAHMLDVLLSAVQPMYAACLVQAPYRQVQQVHVCSNAPLLTLFCW